MSPSASAVEESSVEIEMKEVTSQAVLVHLLTRVRPTALIVALWPTHYAFTRPYLVQRQMEPRLNIDGGLITPADLEGAWLMALVINALSGLQNGQ